MLGPREHVRIGVGRDPNAGMAEEVRDLFDAHPRREQVRGERVAARVKA